MTEKNTGKIRNEKGQFAKGNQEGYRGGRPKKEHCITDYLRELGNLEDGPLKRKRLLDLAEIIWARALAGDIHFVNLIYDRLEGKAPDRLIADIKHEHKSIEEKIKEISNKTPEEIIAEINKEIRADS